MPHAYRDASILPEKIGKQKQRANDGILGANSSKVHLASCNS